MTSPSDFWLKGRAGTLSRKAQSQVWALAWASNEHALGLTQDDIAQEVEKIGGGHPTQRTISNLLRATDEDAEWYPGKGMDEKPKGGAPKKFKPQMQQAVANSAMAIKREGYEPSAPAVIERCPVATTNPATGFPFGEKLIHETFRTKCYDDGASHPWGHIVPYSKTALSPQSQEIRYKWAIAEAEKEYTPRWYFQNVIYVDPCNTVLSDSLQTGFDETQASYGKGPRWMSPDARLSSRNLRASPYATKQARSGDRRAWWFVVLARGRVNVVFMPSGWRQTGAGTAEFVGKLSRALREMLGPDARLPRIICSDRGPGLYRAGSGYIVEKYRKAVLHEGFRTYAGDDGSNQASDLADFWPHETAVAWIRAYMKKHPLKKGVGLDRMQREFQTTMRAAVRHINKEYDVASLCSSFPQRLSELKEAKGARLTH